MAPNETVWEAPEHTKAKIAILKNYLERWFIILGQSNPHPLLYVDVFAGPGEYTNHAEGSPTAALDAAAWAMAVLERQGKWKVRNFHFVFVEKDPARCDHLREKVYQKQYPANFRVAIHNSTFTDALPAIKEQHPKNFHAKHPLFAFVDPFGATSVPFSAVTEFLQSPTSELFLYFDAQGISRIYEASHHNEANQRNLDEIFGTGEWRTHFAPHIGHAAALRNAALDLYKARLNQFGVEYVYQFEMRKSDNLPHHFLIFATRYYKGLEVMKDAMRAIDQSGEFRFVDTHANQPSLLRFDEPQDYVAAFFDAFQNKDVPYEILRDYALLQTPFLNPKQMIKILEGRQAVIVHRVGHPRGVQEGDMVEFKDKFPPPPSPPPSQLPLL